MSTQWLHTCTTCLALLRRKATQGNVAGCKMTHGASLARHGLHSSLRLVQPGKLPRHGLMPMPCLLATALLLRLRHACNAAARGALHA